MKRNEGKFSQTIFIIEIIGVDNNAPGIPHIIPHNNNDNNITTGLTPNLSPITLGVIIFPIVT